MKAASLGGGIKLHTILTIDSSCAKREQTQQPALWGGLSLTLWVCTLPNRKLSGEAMSMAAGREEIDASRKLHCSRLLQL